MLLIDSFGCDFLVVLLERGEVFASFGELPFLHAFADVPVNERTLGVHEVELVVDPREDLGDSRVVADHADGTLDFGEVGSGDNRGGLVIDSTLEPGRAPTYIYINLVNIMNQQHTY